MNDDTLPCLLTAIEDLAVILSFVKDKPGTVTILDARVVGKSQAIRSERLEQPSKTRA